MSEQELYMMGEERAKDEIGAQNMMKKHQTLENNVEDYAEEVRKLGERSRELMEEEHPDRLGRIKTFSKLTLNCSILN